MDHNHHTPSTVAGFDLTDCWPQRISDSDGEALLAFWKAHGAITQEAQARARLAQVVMLAHDADGELAGVCTAHAMTPPQLGQPMYYWREFVAPRWRKTRLFYHLGMRSFARLEAHAAENGFPCVGILLELENERFGTAARMPVWGRSGFMYIGKSARNLDVRIRYFKGARLK